MKNATKIHKSSGLTLTKFLCQALIILSIFSCDNKEELSLESCDYTNLVGNYLFYSATDTSNHKIHIYSVDSNRFYTGGIIGSGFWFPAAPLSGVFEDCNITIDSYENVERKGLSSPGGGERYYYESMSGYGEYYEENDSIKLFITYERTGDFTQYFNGEIFLIKNE